MFKKNLLLIFIIATFQQVLLADTIKVFDFTESEFETLKVKKVRGADAKTKYSLGKNEYGNFIRSESKNAASGLGKEIKIDLSKTPFLNITWKVEKGLPGIDEKSGKCYASCSTFQIYRDGRAGPNRVVSSRQLFSNSSFIDSVYLYEKGVQIRADDRLGKGLGYCHEL